ncbi:MAG: 4'-phosphopantetheinyl transferase superfamily protein [Bifidobacteriaceae bacterium]|nr:4'-phosphopantetheinyl transferase superfamily protein [Bifidobacteriaceae bacterium]
MVRPGADLATLNIAATERPLLVHVAVVRAGLLEDDGVFSQCCRGVSVARRSRIGRHRSANGRRDCLAGSIALDCALQAFGYREADCRYITLSSGKPAFTSPASLHFSITHAGGWAAAAVSLAPVGLDLEPIRATPLQVVRYFTPVEQELLFALGPGESQDRLFWRIWTKKESLAKLADQPLGAVLAAQSVLEGSDGGVLMAEGTACPGQRVAFTQVAVADCLLTLCVGPCAVALDRRNSPGSFVCDLSFEGVWMARPWGF